MTKNEIIAYLENHKDDFLKKHHYFDLDAEVIFGSRFTDFI